MNVVTLTQADGLWAIVNAVERAIFVKLAHSRNWHQYMHAAMSVLHLYVLSIRLYAFLVNCVAYYLI